jgi:hypothetical protein
LIIRFAGRSSLSIETFKSFSAHERYIQQFSAQILSWGLLCVGRFNELAEQSSAQVSCAQVFKSA